jgi:hypothetical protein
MFDDFDLSFLDDELESSPIHKPFYPESPTAELPAAPMSMPGFGWNPRPMTTTPETHPGDDGMTIFDVSKFITESSAPRKTVDLPLPQLLPRAVSRGSSVPSVFKPFASVESTELAVHQLRGMLRGNQRKIMQQQKPSF